MREKCATVAVTAAVRQGQERPAAGGAIGEKRADHLAHITTRSSSLVTLELMGMTGGVRSVPLALPPLPPLPPDGAAEEIDTAAGADVPHGAMCSRTPTCL